MKRLILILALLLIPELVMTVREVSPSHASEWPPTAGRIYFIGTSVPSNWEYWFILNPPKNPATQTAFTFASASVTSMWGVTLIRDWGVDDDHCHQGCNRTNAGAALDCYRYQCIEDAAPEYIIVCTGINDVGMYYHADHSNGSMDTLITQYTAVLAKLKEDCPTCKIIFLSQSPVSYGGSCTAAKHDTTYNAATPNYSYHSTDCSAECVVLNHAAGSCATACDANAYSNSNHAWFNAQIKAYCLAHGMYYADVFAKIAPAATAFYSKYTIADGMHFNDQVNMRFYHIFVKPALEEALSGCN